MTVRVNKISRVVELNDEEETKITEFLAALDSKYVPAPPLLQLLRHRSKTGVPTRESQERMYAYAFLLSRDWNMKKALQMADEAIKFREKEHLDQFNMFPSAFAVRGWPTGDVAEDVCASRPPRPVGRIDRVCAGIDQHFSASLHSWDKEGLPVLYLMVGRVDEAGLLGELKKMANVGQTPTDVMFEYVQHAVSVGEVLAMHQQKLLEEGSLPELRSEDGVLRTVTIVVDAEGLNYKMLWKPALDLFMGSLDRMFRFFPDCVNRIMVVNCPSMVMFAYGIVKVVLNEAVQRKVSFYKPKDTAEALRQVIDEERLPSFLGGTCRCADHCVGSFDPDCPNQRAATTASGDEQDGDVATQDIVLKAGKKHFEVFELDKGEQVVWEFVSEQGHGVTFRVFFVPSHEPNVSMDKPNEEKLTPFLTRHETPSEGMDTFTAKEAGSLVLLWDNKKSWFTAKKLQMKVFKCPVATLPPGASPVSASSPTMESPHHHESEVMPAETV